MPLRLGSTVRTEARQNWQPTPSLPLPLRQARPRALSRSIPLNGQTTSLPFQHTIRAGRPSPRPTITKHRSTHPCRKTRLSFLLLPQLATLRLLPDSQMRLNSTARESCTLIRPRGPSWQGRVHSSTTPALTVQSFRAKEQCTHLLPTDRNWRARELNSITRIQTGQSLWDKVPCTPQHRTGQS